MKKVLILLVVLIATLVVFFLLTDKKVNDYVVYIESVSDEYTKSGTGITYKVDGTTTYILTLYHIIDSSDLVYVYDAHGNMKQAQILNYDASSDLAILEVQDFKSGILDRFKCEYSIGDKIIVYGINDKKKTNKSGVISGDNIAVDIDYSYGKIRYNTFRIESDIVYGDSGSVVLDNKKNVIGIVALKDLDNMDAYSIPICNVMDSISKLENES